MAMVVIAEFWQVANRHGVCMFPPNNLDVCMQDIDLGVYYNSVYVSTKQSRCLHAGY